jgi:hypothetical protein
MKKLTLLLLVFVSVIINSCKKNESDEPTPVVPLVTSSGTTSARYLVHITDQSGSALTGASVSIASASGTTNSEGLCELSSTSFPSGTAGISVSKSGYFKYSGVVTISAGNQSVSVQLVPVTVAGTFSSSSGGTVTVPNGGSILFPANAIDDGSTSYSGTVTVSAVYISPTSTLAPALSPNSFLGKDISGNEKFLENHGMIAVELSGSSGQQLQIAPGNSATITIPVAANDIGSAPSTIPLYYYDAATQLWKEEGSANLVGNFYVGNVNHFTFWMCPFVYDHYFLSNTLQCQSSPLPYVRVEVFNQWGAYLGHTTTNSSGYWSGMIPNILTFTLVVKDPCNSIAYSQTIGPFTANTNMSPIDACSSGANASYITGSFLNCSGNPDAAAFCRVQSDGIMQLLPVNNQGQVNASVLFCSASTLTSISGINLSGGQTSAEQYFTIAPSINFGTQTVCGTAAEFAQFRLNGINYYFTENAFADFQATYNAAQNRIYLNVVGGQFMNEVQLGLIIPGSVAGTYSVGGNPFAYSFITTGNNGTVNLSVTLTQGGTQLGDMVTGSIQNITYVDQGGTNRQLENCYFRIEIDLVQ